MKSEKIEESYAASSKEEEVVKVSEKKVINRNPRKPSGLSTISR